LIGGDEINIRLGALEAHGAREMGSKCYLQSTNFRIRMSEEGHQRRFEANPRTSALSPIPDISLLLLLKPQTKLAQDRERFDARRPRSTSFVSGADGQGGTLKRRRRK
jgi:hypothetical protein